MKRRLQKWVCLVVLIGCSGTIVSQEIPPIQIFTPQEYNAEDQNWGITQSDEKFIYAANNKGLLEYNGASWTLYESPNNTILRSVLYHGTYIYTGAYMDFGFWTKDETNELTYTSLVKSLSIPVLEDEEFWGIFEITNYVVFQSFERIYIYNKKDASFSFIASNGRINKIFRVGEDLFYQEIDQGVFKIENGKALKVISNKLLGNIEIINLFKEEGGLLILTKRSGLLFYDNEKVMSTEVGANALLKERTLYSGIRLKNGAMVLGTISNGIVLLKPNGEVELEINQSQGLGNNTVLSLFEDLDGNIWLGLDNGINLVDLDSPYRVYTDKFGQLGTIYASKVFQGQLYIGTNQGLFVKRYNNKNSEFTFVKGTNGQVWSLDVIDQTLFCGHDNGTYIIQKDSAALIANVKGTWGVKSIPGDNTLLLQGGYKGLYILSNEKGQWQLRNKVEGFDISSRYFEFLNHNELLISHEYKGVYKLNLDASFKRLNKLERLDVPVGIKSSIAIYNSHIWYATNDGVYTYNNDSNKFLRDSLVSKTIAYDNFHSGKLIKDDAKNRLWAFAKNGMVYIEPGQMTEDPELHHIAIPENLRRDKAGFENILHLENERYLVGSTAGYFIIDLDKIEKTQYELVWNRVSSYSGFNPKENLSLALNAGLPDGHTSIGFSYSVPSYNQFSQTQYQYKLKGLFDDWSSWSTETAVSFENLTHGAYEFQVRAMIGGELSQNILSYNFRIAKPWYLKPFAISMYCLAFLLVAFLMHYGNRRYYKNQKKKLIENRERERQMEKLESQKQLVEFKNENLQLDIENKNRELGLATMNFVKRNELLSEIKLRLSKVQSLEEIKPVTNLINNNLNDSNDWKLFEEAFNNVDKDFMKRVKTMHPEITPNDLRLCAYLRLNLSSKEIAPLLNISHKSVEVKRYRLRKKMNLKHDDSLSDYIINL